MKPFFRCIMMFVLASAGISLFAKGNWGADRTKNYSFETSHTGNVTGILADASGKSFFSCGKDGSIIKWSENGSGEKYQVSSYEITEMAKNPAGNDFAIVETDGNEMNAITVFDWGTLTKKFSKRFSEKITGVAYSQRGKYLFVSSRGVSSYYILDAKTGVILKQIGDISSPISLAKTGASEKSAVFYLPAGKLVYYNLVNFGRFKRIDTEASLNQPTLLNMNKYLAAEKNGHIYIIDAMTGKAVNKTAASSPIILDCEESDTVLYYIEKSGKTGLFLKSINVEDSFKTETLGQISLNNEKEAVSCAAKVASSFIIGSSEGNIFKISAKNLSDGAARVSKNEFAKVLDLCSAPDGSVYFIAGKSVYKSSYSSKAVELVYSGVNQTNISSFKNNFVLWSNNSAQTVQYLNSETGKISTLFVPKAKIKNLNVCGEKLVYIQGTASVYSHDVASGASKLLYTGTSVESAVLSGDTLYVAKALVGLTDSSFVRVNTRTKETVPLLKSGFSSCALCCDASSSSNHVFGIVLNDENNAKTSEVFDYDPVAKTTKILFTTCDNDFQAFITSKNSEVFTNLGNNFISSYDNADGNVLIYRRGSSMPSKIEVLENGKIASVNDDGSVSWYEKANRTPLGQWYLLTKDTEDGSSVQWKEFSPF